MALSNLINAWMKTHPPTVVDTDKNPSARKIKKLPDQPPSADHNTISSESRSAEQPTPRAKRAVEIGMNQPHVRIRRNRS